MLSHQPISQSITVIINTTGNEVEKYWKGMIQESGSCGNGSFDPESQIFVEIQEEERQHRARSVS